MSLASHFREAGPDTVKSQSLLRMQQKSLPPRDM